MFATPCAEMALWYFRVSDSNDMIVFRNCTENYDN